MAQAVYYQFTPPVVDQNQTTAVILEVKVAGTPSAVTLRLESTGGEIPLSDDGSGADKVAGDDMWTASLAAADVLYNLTPDKVNRNLVGRLRLYVGSNPPNQYNIFADILTPNISLVDIQAVSPAVQYSEHLVNIFDPAFFSTFSVESVTQKFYQHFGDDYDYLQIVYAVPFFQNRHHLSVRNDVQGIGIPVLPALGHTAAYGSPGRLLGCTVFPLPPYFDGASDGCQHEFGHQWINFLPVAPLNQATPHWPLSDLASDIMGWGTGPNTQGLEFNYDLVPAGSDYQLVPNSDPKVFSDLSLYLMGLLPASQVGAHFVFDNQNQDPSAGLLSGPVTSVSVADIIAQLGPRVPGSAQAQKRFRVATLLVSRDGLLPPQAMRFYDWFAARAEETKVVPYSIGLVKGQTKPFYLSTQTLGRINARIKQHVLIDASRDGGVWWFPQAGPFDPFSPHQGKALAQYLRSLGHKVVELPRPYKIASALLAGYDVVVRAVGCGGYARTELAAYVNYVKNGGNLLLLAEHGPSDQLALKFGLEFAGATRGENLLSNYVSHPLTDQVGPLFYSCGGGLRRHPRGAAILGRLSNLSFLDLDGNGMQDPGEPSAPPVLGAMIYGEGRVVFCGDANLWQMVPQPLVDNLMRWFAAP
jgi:hypothetical protein